MPLLDYDYWILVLRCLAVRGKTGAYSIFQHISVWTKMVDRLTEQPSHFCIAWAPCLHREMNRYRWIDGKKHREEVLCCRRNVMSQRIKWKEKTVRVMVVVFLFYCTLSDTKENVCDVKKKRSTGEELLDGQTWATLGGSPLIRGSSLLLPTHT